VSTSHTSAHQDDDACTTLSLPFEPRSVRVARKEMAAELERHGLPQRVIDDAALVMAELATNGIDHGRANSRGQIDVSWCLADDVLRISVCDSGEATTVEAISFNDYALRGRGLAIVEHLCDSWRVEHDGGLRVTAELRYQQSLEHA
jgi:anti-sigma regulatory factor (Ser/Thr protein kinase)